MSAITWRSRGRGLLWLERLGADFLDRRLELLYPIFFCHLPSSSLQLC
jgi:hypothetical protein